MLFYRFAELLGVKWFKKYWPVKGSYWNSQHMDKTDRTDLTNIFADVKDYTRQHVQVTATIIIMSILGYCTGVIPMAYLNYFLYVLMPMEAYAFMVQRYNYMKLKEAWGKLPNVTPVVKPDYNTEEPISIYHVNTFFEYVRDTEVVLTIPDAYYCKLYGSHIKSKLFTTLETCQAFRRFIYQKHSRDFVNLFNTLTTDEMKNLERSF